MCNVSMFSGEYGDVRLQDRNQPGANTNLRNFNLVGNIYSFLSLSHFPPGLNFIARFLHILNLVRYCRAALFKNVVTIMMLVT
jgi:hypothetical protein